jgi:hypothetical protein
MMWACFVVCCPVQVRMQSEGKKAPGEPKKYANAFKAYGIIARWEHPRLAGRLAFGAQCANLLPPTLI